MTEQSILIKCSEVETTGIRFCIMSGDAKRILRQVSQTRREIELRMSATRNTVIHASLSNNYVLELVIGKGALKDTFL